jgi:hypothetical protein
MREARELQTQIEHLERCCTDQHSDIYRLRLKIRSALAALQAGATLDVAAAIEILRGAK